MAKKKDEALWAEYRTALETEWDAHMADYCYKSTAELVRLPNGKIIPIDKEGIDTHFCFGYSDWYGPTEDEACASANYARTHEDYFMEQNMRVYREALEELDRHGASLFAVVFPHYHEESNVCGLYCKRTSEVLDAFGGSAFLDDLKGQEMRCGEVNGYICTDEDVALLKAGYERAAKAHERKLHAYLKRYGLSKLHVWTYWRDE